MECKFKQPTFNVKIGSMETDCFFRQHNGRHLGYCNRPDMYRCLEDVWKKPTLISHTGAQSFLTCHHQYYLKYIRGIETRNTKLGIPLKIGILWDACLQFMLGDTSTDMNKIIDDYEIEDKEVSKVHALYRAAKALEIQFDMNCKLQHSFFHNIKIHKEPELENDVITVNGKYDRYYEDGFVESKLSTRPDNYSDIFFIQSQVGTYFAVDPNLKWCQMEVVRVPDLKSTGQYKDESTDMYGERCYQDIISRPSFYFIGWDKGKKTFGKRYFRTEFALDEILDRYKAVAREIMWASYHDSFYKNDRVCNNVLPGIQCDMLSICRHNMMNEETYRIKTTPKPKEKGEKK